MNQSIEKSVDTPQMVQYCLNCPWDECWNCLGRTTSYSRWLRVELGDDRYLQSLIKKYAPLMALEV